MCSCLCCYRRKFVRKLKRGKKSRSAACTIPKYTFLLLNALHFPSHGRVDHVSKQMCILNKKFFMNYDFV